MRVMKRGKTSVMKVEIAEGKVTYTCPKCFHRQTHKWYGREKHLCSNCEEWTDIKGESAPAKPIRSYV